MPKHIYLADLEPIAKLNWPFNPPKKDFPKGGKGPPNGKGPPDGKGPPPDGKGPPPDDFDGEIRVGGKAHPKAIFMHPPGGGLRNYAKITYKVPVGYLRFAAKATMRDEPRGNGSMHSENPGSMIVYGNDGKILWESHDIHSRAEERDCRISVGTQATITIATTSDGDPMGCHLVWLDPRFLKPAP